MIQVKIEFSPGASLVSFRTRTRSPAASPSASSIRTATPATSAPIKSEYDDGTFLSTKISCPNYLITEEGMLGNTYLFEITMFIMFTSSGVGKKRTELH